MFGMIQRALLILAALPVLVLAQSAPTTATSATSRAATSPATAPRASGANPIGLMVGGGKLTVQQRVDLAKLLGAAYFRPMDVSMEEWKGTPPDAQAAQKAGLKLILTVRANGKISPIATPTNPPTDLPAYGKTLGAILDTLKPELLVVENEETSGASYTGTPEQYSQQLKVACEVAHSKGVKCTNGGLSGNMLMMLVCDSYRRKGEDYKADDFLKRVSTPQQVAMMRTTLGKQRADETIKKGKELLKGYKAAGIDYVNFHWYVIDPDALQETVEFLKAETGLDAITNEIGQRDQRPTVVRGLLMKVAELKLPYAIWYSMDRLESRGLQEPDGTPRENGVTFQATVQAQFIRRR